MTTTATCVGLSVVIPVYNSSCILPMLLQRLLPVLRDTGTSYEVILVDDGSRDESWHCLTRLREEYPKEITAVQLMRNFGQHNALMCGLRLSRGECVITMDDDLQHAPEDIPAMLAKLYTNDLDLVYGVFVAKKHAGWRNVGSAVVNLVYRSVFNSRNAISAFRAVRRQLLETVFSYTLNFTFLDGLFAWNTIRIGQVHVRHCQRLKGQSGYTLRRLVGLGLNLFTNFSILPLQLSLPLGLIAAMGGIGLGIYYLAQYFLANITVPGYASIITSILVMGGLQLLALGVIGQYLGRLHLNVNRMPQYSVRQLLLPADRNVPDENRSASAEPFASPNSSRFVSDRSVSNA